MPQKSKEHAFDRPFERAARWLLDKGIQPNHITFLQIPVLAVMVWAAWNHEVWWFFSLSWVVMVLDGADGMVARVGGTQSRSGAILDASLDTLGILVVLWGATRFHPDQAWAWWSLLALNGALYAQNVVLEEKVVTYVRGPVLLAVAFPNVLWLAIVGTLVISLWLIATRLPATVQTVARDRA